MKDHVVKVLKGVAICLLAVTFVQIAVLAARMDRDWHRLRADEITTGEAINPDQIRDRLYMIAGTLLSSLAFAAVAILAERQEPARDLDELPERIEIPDPPTSGSNIMKGR